MALSLATDSAGNMAISAVAVLMFLAAIGGGIDISRAYMAKSNLQSACDAGVLAGRKALAKSGTYGTAEKAKADKMFNFNLRPAQTQATDVVFDSVSHDDGSVSGTASVTIPTIVMKIFKFRDFDLSVECSAELQMASADVMFVLDTTGSMAGSRIQGLRDAVEDFHKTVAQAVIDKEKTVIRYAFVPYSMTVNVSGLVTSGAMRSDWLADSTSYQTKVAKFDYKDYIGEDQSSSPVTRTSKENEYTTENSCKNWANSDSVTTGEKPHDVTKITYKYVKNSWNSSKKTCQRTETTTVTSYTAIYRFSGWSYKQAAITTSGVAGGFNIISSLGSKTGSDSLYYVSTEGEYDMRTLAALKDQPGNNLPSYASVGWNGCLEERKTTVDLKMDPVPDEALDLNINDAPVSWNDDTKWKPYLPKLIFLRNGNGPSTNACPSTMRQFEEVDTRNPSTVPDWLHNYLLGLVAQGNTYHDIGMIWGARLASTNGIFKDNVLAGDRNSVSRHIIFMTDGAMDTVMNGYDAYGVESLDRRVTPSGTNSETTLDTYHTNRFLAACRKAREEGYTIWVIGFGTSITTAMRTCSSANRAYAANSTDELKAAFRYIAGQVADLRLNK